MVEQCNVVASRHRQGTVGGFRNMTVHIAAHELDALVAARILLDDLHGPHVGRRIIDDAQLPVRIYLRKHAFDAPAQPALRSEEHTSELQSLMRISYAVFCLKKKKKTHTPITPFTANHKKS